MPNPFAKIPWDGLTAVLSRQKLSICHVGDADFAIVDAGGRGLGEVGQLKWHQVDDIFRKTGGIVEAAKQLLTTACGAELAKELAPDMFKPPPSPTKVSKRLSPDTQELLRRVRERGPESATK